LIRRPILIIVYCVAAIGFLHSQSSYRAGILPVINFTVPVSDNWKLNIRYESRHILREGLFSRSSSFDYNYQLSDLAAVASRPIGLGKFLAGGMQIRHSSGNLEFRLMQQFTYSPLNVGFRSVHRIAMDQSFRESKPARYRLRYRYAVQWALNGQSIDLHEWYIKLGSEILNAVEGADYDLEFRILPFLGYRLNSDTKIELGLDYRLGGIMDDSMQHSIWQTFALYSVF